MITINDKQLESLCWDYLEKGYNDDMASYAADFETTTAADDCRVWAFAACNVNEPDALAFGNNIDDFISWCEVNSGSRVYFHNLKFDGKFIVSYLLQNGWKWVSVKEEADVKTFTTLISDMNQWYSIKIWFTENKCVEFLDSLKIIPLSIAEIPKAFGLPISKLDLDYVAPREIGHELTEDEKDYISNDVKIAAMALKIMFDQGMMRMTAGSNAFKDYQETIGGKLRFRDWFPEPDYDRELREGGCYKGGFCSMKEEKQGVVTEEGISFDVNSLYPSVMAGVDGELLPYGEPIYYEGEYEYDEEYPLYIQFVECDFKVKPDHIPCIQLKGNGRFVPTEYIKDSNGLVTMCLTSVDIEMLFKQYDVGDYRAIRGYKFKGSTELFKDYVYKWNKIKVQASIDGNDGLRTIAKLELNSLYGKLATNPVKQSRMPYLDDDGIVKYKLLNEEYAEAIYLPCGAFITSWARRKTITAAQNNYSRWLYSDTDSCYFEGTEMPVGMTIDDNELGAWKLEHRFDRFKGLGAKAYCFEENGDLTVHCAGMPYRCHNVVSMENFNVGGSFAGKLKPVDVKGGTILVEDVYTIRDRRSKQ